MLWLPSLFMMGRWSLCSSRIRMIPLISKENSREASGLAAVISAIFHYPFCRPGGREQIPIAEKLGREGFSRRISSAYPG